LTCSKYQLIVAINEAQNDVQVLYEIKKWSLIMIQIVREFVVKETYRGQFELAFGPGGFWGKLYSQCSGFKGTTVLRDTEQLKRYLVIDMWDTQSHWRQAQIDHKSDYNDLHASLAEWTESSIEVGKFRIMAEATVRPVRKIRTGKRR
jgi:hypothetical protein